MELKEALTKLDHANDGDWNRGGQPSIDRLKELTGDANLTRAQIVEAAPDLDRDRAKAAAGDKPSPRTGEIAPEPVPVPNKDQIAAGSEMPAWAADLQRRLDEQDQTIAGLRAENEELRESGATRARQVVDGDLTGEQAMLNPDAQNSDDRPAAAPTPISMVRAAGDSTGIMTPRNEAVTERIKKRWPAFKGKEVTDMPVVAIAIGQYPAQPGKLRAVGEHFTFTGIPGSWFVPAQHPDLPAYLSGELGQADAEELWGLRKTETLIG